jgi:hypothetical protein
VLEGLGKYASHARCALHAIDCYGQAMAAVIVLMHYKGNIHRLQQTSSRAELTQPIIDMQAVEMRMGHCSQGMDPYHNWKGGVHLRGIAGQAMSVSALLVPAG